MVYFLFGVPLDSDLLSDLDLSNECQRLGIDNGGNRFMLVNQLIGAGRRGAVLSTVRPDVDGVGAGDIGDAERGNALPPILPHIQILTLGEISVMLVAALKTALTARDVEIPRGSTRQHLRDLLSGFETHRLQINRVDEQGVGGDVGADVEDAAAGDILRRDGGNADGGGDGDGADSAVVGARDGGRVNAFVNLDAARSAFMNANLQVFDEHAGLALNAAQGQSSTFRIWIQEQAGQLVNPVKSEDVMPGHVLVQLSGTSWATSTIAALFLFTDRMHTTIRWTKLYHVGVSPGEMSNKYIAFPRLENIVPYYFILNARGIAIIAGALSAARMAVPTMIASVDPTLVDNSMTNQLLDPAGVQSISVPQQVVVSSSMEKKEETRKKAEHRIVDKVSSSSELVTSFLFSILANGETNSNAFRSRMMAHLESQHILTFRAPAFQGFLVSALFLANFTSSPEIQKPSDKQSVRLEDLVVNFNPLKGEDQAPPWEAFLALLNSVTSQPSAYGALLRALILEWITSMRSGRSPATMHHSFLTFVNRRKWAALGLAIQDAASENMSEDDALDLLHSWGFTNTQDLEQEYLDHSRNARQRENEEKAAKKQRLDNGVVGGGGGRLGGGGRGGRGGANRGGRGTSAGRGGWVPPIPLSTVPTHGQYSTQAPKANYCLDNICDLLKIPHTQCNRNPCKFFPHYMSLQEVDRAVLEGHVRGILKHSPKMPTFLQAMVNVKFKGE